MSGSAGSGDDSGRVAVAVRPPAISVVITTGCADATIDTALRSLAAQTLAPELFEVVVVTYGPAADADVLRAYPRLAVRRLSCGDVAPGRARNAGLAMARGEFVTFVGDCDRVSPGLLSALLDSGAPGVVAFAHLADLVPDRLPDLAVDDGFARLARAGELVSAEVVGAGLGTAVAKLFPLPLARVVGFDPALPHDDDVDFCLRFFADHPLPIRVCPVDAAAVYYRDVASRAVRLSRTYQSAVADRLDVVQHLDALPAPAWAGPLVQSLIDGQVVGMNGFLRHHPDRHRDTVDEIDARGITSVTWELLNAGVARDLAILYLSVPQADTSALVAARRIDAARRLVDVLTIDLRGARGLDAAADAVWCRYLGERARLRSLPTLGGDWPRIAAFCRDGLRQLEEWAAAKGPYRSVYSRTMAPASHLLAAWYKLRNPDVRWTAEFSDPQLYNPKRETRLSVGEVDAELFGALRAGYGARGHRPPEDPNVWLWVELLAYALADEIVFTNEHQRDYMLGYCDDPALAERARTVSRVEHHPVPAARLYRAVASSYELEPGVVHVGYFGVFYATRGLTEVLDAFRALTPDQRGRVRLHVFTPRPDVLAEEIAQAGLTGVVRPSRYVGYLEYLNLTTRLDVLLVNDYRTGGIHPLNPYLPAKYADYAGSGREIWGVVEPGSVLDSCRLDHRSELGDVAGARAVLERLAARAARVRSRPMPEHAH